MREWKIQHLLFIRWNEWMKFQGQPEWLYEKNIVILLLSINSFEKFFDKRM